MKSNVNPRNTLPFVTKPGRYLGHEYNAHMKEWEDTSMHCALIFPDLYEIGMSHQGLQILYHIINSNDNFLADRCYCPDKDMEELLRSRDFPLQSLESNHPLKDFDLLGITLPFELCYTNILTIFDLAGIAFYAKDRDETTPVILGGGSCSLNPEPVADFFDAILLGDGEEAILEITASIALAKEKGLSRKETMTKLAAIDGVYIPSLYEPHYGDDGKFSSIRAKSPEFLSVTRRVISNLNSMDHLLYPLVPNSKIVHDRLGVEIARGCTRGCRFCQAGFIYRPVRERSPEEIFDLACQGIEHSGFNELALLSLSTGDYSCLSTVLPKLMDRFADEAISVSMPSMRVGTLTEDLMAQIKRVRKTGFTLAPEAGSERLRRVINKGIIEEDLLTTSKDAFGLGWKIMKLYFMIGLPTETNDDIEAIADLAIKTKNIGNQAAGGRQKITVSIGTFVPKPHTPFQWARQISMEESRNKINSLKKLLPRKGINLKWHDPEQSLLEGVFSRGDRRLAKLLETAWGKGARLDSWSDYFDLSRWKNAAEECGLTLDDFLLPRDIDHPLPWQHLQSGIDDNFLKAELEKAGTEDYTPDCRYHACQKCGLCDFNTIQPVVIDRKQQLSGSSAQNSVLKTENSAAQTNNGQDSHFKYMVHYSRLGDICYLGHLEILQIVFRILRRAKIKTNFSNGFNPSPKVSFGSALPVGTESLAEYFVMDLPRPLKDPAETVARLNKQMPPGLQVQSIHVAQGTVPQQVLSSYTITITPPPSAGDVILFTQFMQQKEFIIERTRKRKTKQINIRPLVEQLAVQEDKSILMQVISKASQAGVKPLEAIAAILKRDQQELLSSKILKTEWKELV